MNLYALLTLGRVSLLPTVWSNCLAGWVLAGGHGTGRLAGVCPVATMLFLGAAFLNDAFDAEFDRERRPARPIPSGRINRRQVWQIGSALLVLGVVGAGALGSSALLLALMAAGAAVIYHATHRRTPLAALLPGICRFLLYLLAADAAGSIHGHAIWCGLALGAYAAGVSYLARKETRPGPVAWWPLLSLGAPVLLALLLNGSSPDGTSYLERAVYLSLLLVIWILPGLRFAFGREARQIGFAVANLQAGMVLVDLLATVGEPWGVLPAFAVFFLATLLLQRFVPAT